jgi:ubiquinone/menaquinone biosynthesis C-methylase UbiE
MAGSPRQSAARSHDRVAWCYDELAAAWSLGAIPRAKAWVAEQLEPGSRVLFAGAGRGADALQAARRGVRVTALDVSPRMLARFEASLQREDLRAEICCANVFDVAASEGPFDAVVASFFLNVFDAVELVEAVDALAKRLACGGDLWVVDFAPPAGSAWRRAAAQLYYAPVALVGAALGLAALHPIHDYRRSFAASRIELDLELEHRSYVGLYRVLRAQRRS